MVSSLKLDYKLEHAPSQRSMLGGSPVGFASEHVAQEARTPKDLKQLAQEWKAAKTDNLAAVLADLVAGFHPGYSIPNALSDYYATGDVKELTGLVPLKRVGAIADAIQRELKGRKTATARRSLTAAATGVPLMYGANVGEDINAAIANKD